jgi:sigma-E factor negative regulatory protein RseB
MRPAWGRPSGGGLAAALLALGVLMAAAGAACAASGKGGTAASPGLPGAANADDALAWFNRLVVSSQRLSYTGTFVYQQGDTSETARIAHRVDAQGVRERVEVLDGSPREIIQAGGEVECFLPETMTLKIEKWAGERSLLPVLPTSANISEFYTLRKADRERISGFEAQTLVLEPRDGMRYGHKFWADSASGMILKAQTLNAQGEVIEQLMFTQLQVGGVIPPERLTPRYSRRTQDWRIEESAAHPADLGQDGWSLVGLPAGYATMVQLKRSIGHTQAVGQIVLSDGLSSVSVFIEPQAAAPNPAPFGASRAGAFSVYKRKLEPYVITAVGEAPEESVRTIAESLAFNPHP